MLIISNNVYTAKKTRSSFIYSSATLILFSILQQKSENSFIAELSTIIRFSARRRSWVDLQKNCWKSKKFGTELAAYLCKLLDTEMIILDSWSTSIQSCEHALLVTEKNRQGKFRIISASFDLHSNNQKRIFSQKEVFKVPWKEIKFQRKLMMYLMIDKFSISFYLKINWLIWWITD